jgi:acyl carrier protein phosphodiesterase
MNFLGHLLLTYPHRELTMGNLLGDLVRGQEAKHLSPVLRQGIALHHEIDHYTDNHHGVRKLITLVRPTHAKYAPVVVDILLDHILANQWDSYAELSYPDFTQWIYDLVPEFLSLLSEPVVMRLEGMLHHRWIDDYDTTEKLQQVLMRMDKRASFPSQFVSGIQDIGEHYDTFAATFEEFYPTLREKLSLDVVA